MTTQRQVFVGLTHPVSRPDLAPEPLGVQIQTQTRAPKRKRQLNRRSFLRSAIVSSLAGALMPAPFFWGQTNDGLKATVDFDSNAAGVPFNRMIFGHFLEHFHRQVYGGAFEPGSPLANERGFRKDVITALRELKVPIVRWPGGCFVSSYHWFDGIGGNRKPSFDKAWGVEDPNTFGTDEYVEWCKAIGAEPYICTNAGSGTAEEMSDWVEYCNLSQQGRYARMRQANGYPQAHNVKYWSIGNENYGGWEIGAKTAAEWALLVRESAKMMRAVDKGIKLLAAATTGRDWTVPLLKQAGSFLDFISIHGYWAPQWSDNTPIPYDKCMMWTTGPDQSIRDALKLLDETGFKDRIKIAFDEWNLRGWHHPGFPGGGTNPDLIRARDRNDNNSLYTMADAVFSGCFLNACLRNAQAVQMACIAPGINTRGPLFVHPNGIVRRSTFHVLKMYADLLQPLVVRCTVQAPEFKHQSETVPLADCIVTRSDDARRWAIALINKHPSEMVAIKLAPSQFTQGQIKATILTGDSPDAFNDIAQPNRVVPEVINWTAQNGFIQLPPHSVSIAESTIG